MPRKRPNDRKLFYLKEYKKTRNFATAIPEEIKKRSTEIERFERRRLKRARTSLEGADQRARSIVVIVGASLTGEQRYHKVIHLSNERYEKKEKHRAAFSAIVNTANEHR